VELMRRSDYRTIEMLHGRVVADTADPGAAERAAARAAEDRDAVRGTGALASGGAGAGAARP
jgi:hypothetical protein